MRKKVESANQGCEAKKPETSPVKKRKRRSRDALQTLNENGQNISGKFVHIRTRNKNNHCLILINKKVIVQVYIFCVGVVFELE